MNRNQIQKPMTSKSSAFGLAFILGLVLFLELLEGYGHGREVSRPGFPSAGVSVGLN